MFYKKPLHYSILCMKIKLSIKLHNLENKIKTHILKGFTTKLIQSAAEQADKFQIHIYTSTKYGRK